MNHWYAECLPCRRQERHPNQEAAIKAAETHVVFHHAGVPGAERARRVIGHVQQRSETAFAMEMPGPAPEPEAAIAPAPGPVVAEPPGPGAEVSPGGN